jgi:glycosyltransferase involved in cell wall biosynthesis
MKKTNSKKKILQVTTFYMPTVGGVETQVEDLALQLKKKGYDVEVLTTDHARQNPRLRTGEFEINRVSVTRVKTKLSLSQFHKFAPGIYTQLMKKDYDVVHVHGIRKPETYMAFLAAKLRGKRVVVSTHNPFVAFGRSKLLKFLIMLHDVTLGVLLMRFIDHYFLLSGTEISILSRFGISKNKMTVVGNALNEEYFTDYEDVTASGEPEGLDDKIRPDREDLLRRVDALNTKGKRLIEKVEKKEKEQKVKDIREKEAVFKKETDSFSGNWKAICLGVGRINIVKGFQYLQKAAVKLKDVLFVIVGGDDNYLDTLQKKLGDLPNVRLLGKFVDRDELHELFYRNSDIFLLPSKYEPFGIVLLEAMASGCAVIASQNGGPKDILQNGEYGLLVNPKDQDAWVEAIEKLTSSKKVLKSFQQKAIKRAKDYSWQKILPKYLTVYDV